MKTIALTREGIITGNSKKKYKNAKNNEKKVCCITWKYTIKLFLLFIVADNYVGNFTKN